MTTRVLFNDEIDSQLWDSLTDCSLFHSRVWISVLCDSYKLTPFFALSYNDRHSYALIAACSVRGHYVSLPYTYLSGFLTTSLPARAALERTLVEKGIEIRYREMGEFHEHAPRATSILRIDAPDAYWKSLSHNTRNQVRKAESEPFEFCPQGSVDEFYDVMARNMHRLGTPVHARRFYERFHDAVPGTRIFTVRRDGKVVAAMCGVIANDAIEHREPTFYVLWACALQDYCRLYVNYFLYWRMLKTVTDEGIRLFDLGYSLPGSGVFQFKQKLRPRNFGVYDYRVGSPHCLPSQRDSFLAKWASSAWAALPYSVTLSLGPKVRKYLV